MEVLLQHIQEVLGAIQGVHGDLEVLGQLFTAFEKIQNIAAQERRQLKTDLERETTAGVQLRLLNSKVESVGTACIKAWIRALQCNCTELTTEERALLYRAVELEWIKLADVPAQTT